MKRFPAVFFAFFAGSPAMAQAALCTSDNWWGGTDVDEDCLAAQAARQSVEAAAQAAALADLRKQVANAELAAQECAANCEPAAKKAVVGPSKIRKDLEALAEEVAALQGAEAPDSVTHEELNKLLARLDALEDAVPVVTAPPIQVEGPPGPAGEDGRDGRDGRSAEITTSVGVTTAAADEWSHTGLELALTVGGRPTEWLIVGGYANGDFFARDSLGFAVGAGVTVQPEGWAVQFPFEGGWREAGIHFENGYAQHAIQGIELRGGVGMVADVGFTARITAGGWFPGGDDGSAFIGQLSGGWRF